jgi:hypothetical protein
MFMIMMDAIPENTTAHSNAYPKFTPALVAVVMVPGPINALVITAAGPAALTFSIKVFFFLSTVIPPLNLMRVSLSQHFLMEAFY